VASNLRSAAAAAAAEESSAGGQPSAPGGALQAQIYHHALATGFSRGYRVSAGIFGADPDHRTVHDAGQPC
jgi:hypothetical protein